VNRLPVALMLPVVVLAMAGLWGGSAAPSTTTPSATPEYAGADLSQEPARAGAVLVTGQGRTSPLRPGDPQEAVTTNPLGDALRSVFGARPVTM
jgi:hypothetical protein